MSNFFQYLVSGLSTGSIYALVALGLALIYRSTRILNFAHGDITTAGTFFAFMLIGFGVRTLSVAWPALPEMRALVGRFQLDAAQDASHRALSASSSAEVLEILGGAVGDDVDLNLHGGHWRLQEAAT